MGIRLQFLLRNPPPDGIAGHQQVPGGLVGKAVLHQADAHVGPLRKARQHQRTPIVAVFQIIGKRRLYILIGQREPRLAFRFWQGVDVQSGLTVIGCVEAAGFVVDALFHVGGAQKAGAGLLVVHRHVEGLLRAGKYRGANEKDVGRQPFAVGKIGPAFRQRVIRDAFRFRTCGPQGHHQQPYEGQACANGSADAGTLSHGTFLPEK